MRRRAHKRRLRSGKIVNVRASFSGSPNRSAPKFTAKQIHGAKMALQRKVMIELGGHLGPALKSVHASDADAIKLLTRQRKADIARYGHKAGWRR